MNAKAILEYIEKLENQVDEKDRIIEELKTEIEELKDKLQHEIQYRQDNFKPISEMELYGLSESDFH